MLKMRPRSPVVEFGHLISYALVPGGRFDVPDHPNVPAGHQNVSWITWRAGMGKLYRKAVICKFRRFNSRRRWRGWCLKANTQSSKLATERQRFA
jgi:hypothetical protein